MIHAYNEEYVHLAQRILGDAFDFAVVTIGWDIQYFADLFTTSQASLQFAAGNPSYVAGITGCELVRKVIAEHNMKMPDVEDEMFVDKSPEYWAGFSLAFYQWYTGEAFDRILTVVPMKEIVNMYHPYHEMDIMQFVEVMNEKMQN